MKYLIMCEGPNELEIVKILLEAGKLIYSSDDLLNLVPYHARQIGSSSAVKNALNLFPGPVTILRIGDKQNEKLKIPKEYQGRIVDVKKFCTKPELEMLLIISENLVSEFEKVKSTVSPKTFSKEKISYHRSKYDNSTAFYREYYGDRVDLLVESIRRYKQLKGKHERDEGYLCDLLR